MFLIVVVISVDSFAVVGAILDNAIVNGYDDDDDDKDYDDDDDD